MAGQKVVIITDTNFEPEILSSKVPAILDFWAESCVPCREVGRVVEELAGEYDGKLKVGKINVDENSKVPVRFGIWGLPTVLVFKEGKVVDQLVGKVANPKKRLADILRKVIR